MDGPLVIFFYIKYKNDSDKNFSPDYLRLYIDTYNHTLQGIGLSEHIIMK